MDNINLCVAFLCLLTAACFRTDKLQDFWEIDPILFLFDRDSSFLIFLVFLCHVLKFKMFQMFLFFYVW